MRENVRKNLKSYGSHYTSALVEMISDLHFGAGLTYGDIAQYIGVSAAGVHRVGCGKRQEPKYSVGLALMKLYYLTFYGPHRSPHAAYYISLKAKHHLDWIQDVSASFEKNIENKKEKQ